MPLRILLAAACLVAPAIAQQTTSQPARQVAQHLERQITTTVEMDYLLYLPRGYNADQQKRWPLLLFLHGMGERGNNLEVVKKHGPPKLIEAGRDLPFIVVSPQCPDDRFWETHVLAALLDSLQETHRVDPDRVYLTGLSMGGFGTWHLAGTQPHRFAAIAPVCGGGKTDDAQRLATLPIWAFHGEDDRVVPLTQSRAMVDAINKAGGKAKLTVYPKVGHDSWTETYDNPALYEWLLKHRRTAGHPGKP